jgi:hypothetical protein
VTSIGSLSSSCIGKGLGGTGGLEGVEGLENTARNDLTQHLSYATAAGADFDRAKTLYDSLVAPSRKIGERIEMVTQGGRGHRFGDRLRVKIQPQWGFQSVTTLAPRQGMVFSVAAYCSEVFVLKLRLKLPPNEMSCDALERAKLARRPKTVVERVCDRLPGVPAGKSKQIAHLEGASWQTKIPWPDARSLARLVMGSQIVTSV